MKAHVENRLSTLTKIGSGAQQLCPLMAPALVSLGKFFKLCQPTVNAGAVCSSPKAVEYLSTD